ncbi:MAG: NifU family protein [Acidobacteria bacterium]|nr:NifU family protein [Acidobacteriota bacterium]
MEAQNDKAVEDKIAITGEPTMNPATCKFIVDRPVYPGKSAYFGSRDAAEPSLLAKRLFEIAEVESILIADNQITVTKSGSDPWPRIGKNIGTGIREHIRSGDPAVDEGYVGTVPGESEIRRKVQDLFDREINPALGSHGGSVELVDVKGNSIYVKLGGGCQGCASAKMTLKMGIERILREKIPELGEVLDATDHTAGNNPYYQQP